MTIKHGGDLWADGGDIRGDQHIGEDPANGILAARRPDGTVATLVRWHSDTGDVEYSAPRSNDAHVRPRHVFDGEVFADASSGHPKSLFDPSYPIEPEEKRMGLPVVDTRFRPGVPERYGAVGDCHGNTPALLAAATDSTAGIQAAIDYVIYGGAPYKVEMLGGGYKTTDTIHLGYGGRNFNSVVVEGQGFRMRAHERIAGTAIFASRTDRPAVNVQGARGSVLRGVAIMGRLDRHIVSNHMSDVLQTTSAVDDTNPDNWDDPALGGARCDSRYAPYAGISIDAYSGKRPAVSYPDVAYPPYAEGANQYGRRFSHDVRLEDCYIGGFSVGVANQPCDDDGNGDYTTLDHVYIEWCKWGVSVGNTQSRNLSLRDVKMSQIYTCLTNRIHGRQMGKFGGSICDLSVAGAIQIIDFNGYYAEPIHFVNFYGETLWRIGQIISSNTAELTIIFSAADFWFTLQIPSRGIPARLLKGGYAVVDFQFQGCCFVQYPSVMVFDMLGVSFEGCYARHLGKRVQPYERLAHNALVGGFVTRRLETPMRSRLKSTYYDIDTGALTSFPQFTARWKHSSRGNGIPFYAEHVEAADELWDDLPLPKAGGTLAKTKFLSIALNGLTLTLVFATLPDWLALQAGPSPGDVIYDEESASVFFVRAREGTTVTAILQNNYRGDATRPVLLEPFSTKTGNLNWRNARLYTPPRYLRGDLKEHSAQITNVATDDGDSSWWNSEIMPGDALMVTPQRDRFVDPAWATIVERDQVTATITLGGSEGVRSQTRRRLDFFVRKPPPNV